MTDDAESVEPKARLATVWGTRGSSRYGVKLVVEPLELLRLPEARGEVPLEALEDFLVPRQHWVFNWLCCCGFASDFCSFVSCAFLRIYCSLLTDSPTHFLTPNLECNVVSANAFSRGSRRLLRAFIASPSFYFEKALSQKNQDFRCDKEMARQGEIREGEMPPFEDEAPRQGAPRIPEGSQQDKPVGEKVHNDRRLVPLM